MTIALLGSAALGTALVGGGVILALQRSLHTVLWELCVLEHRARFWQRTCSLELGAGVALAATLGAATASPQQPIAGAVATVLRWELAGAAAGVVAIALVVARETARAALMGPPACADGEDAWPAAGT